MFLLVTLSALAIWRLTHMLQEEEGPMGLFSRLQAWAASKPDTNGGINHGFFCFYCLSVWVSFPFAVLLSYNGSNISEYLVTLIITWFSLSAIAILINNVNNRL